MGVSDESVYAQPVHWTIIDSESGGPVKRSKWPRPRIMAGVKLEQLTTHGA